MSRLDVVANAAPRLAAAVLLFTSAIAIGALGWRGWELGGHLDHTLSSADATLEQVNRPCGAKDAQGKLLAPGMLCNVSKMVTHFGDLTVTAQKQVAETDLLVAGATKALNVAASSLQSTSTALDGQLSHVGPALDSLKLASDAIPPAINGVSATLLDKTNGLPPILAHADSGFVDLDALIKSPDMLAAVKNVNTMSGNFASMSTDAQTKFHALLFPPPCHDWRCHIGETINDVRIGSEFIMPSFYLKQLLTGDAVVVDGTVHVQQ